MHFQLTKYKVFLSLNQGSFLDPHIVSRCLDALSGFDEYMFHHVHWGLPLWFRSIVRLKKMYPTMHLFCPLKISYNALICNILIFEIIFDYDFRQVLINIWSESVTKRSQNRPIWQMFKTSELPGLRPWTPARSPTARGGPLDPMPINVPLASLATL